MSLADISRKAVQSKIWKLTKDSKVLGFRVKAYNLEKDEFMYYDFDIDIVKKLPDLLEFFKDKIKTFESNPLISKNGRLYTQEELDGLYDAQELFSDSDVVSVLKPVILLYKGGILDV